MLWFKSKPFLPKFHIGDYVIEKKRLLVYNGNPPIGKVIDGWESFYMDTGRYFMYTVKFNGKTKDYSEDKLMKR
jgi:hypothetical protein